MEMPVRGKHGKPNPGFPPFPPPLEIPQNQRDSHIPTASMIVPIYKVRTKIPDLKPSTVRVGQIKLPKWAKWGCQTHRKFKNHKEMQRKPMGSSKNGVIIEERLLLPLLVHPTEGLARTSMVSACLR
jgi:hypothetical protein